MANFLGNFSLCDLVSWITFYFLLSLELSFFFISSSSCWCQMRNFSFLLLLTQFFFFLKMKKKFFSIFILFPISTRIFFKWQKTRITFQIAIWLKLLFCLLSSHSLTLCLAFYWKSFVCFFSECSLLLLFSSNQIYDEMLFLCYFRSSIKLKVCEHFMMFIWSPKRKTFKMKFYLIYEANNMSNDD